MASHNISWYNLLCHTDNASHFSRVFLQHRQSALAPRPKLGGVVFSPGLRADVLLYIYIYIYTYVYIYIYIHTYIYIYIYDYDYYIYICIYTHAYIYIYIYIYIERERDTYMCTIGLSIKTPETWVESLVVSSEMHSGGVEFTTRTRETDGEGSPWREAVETENHARGRGNRREERLMKSVRPLDPARSLGGGQEAGLGHEQSLPHKETRVPAMLTTESCSL